MAALAKRSEPMRPRATVRAQRERPRAAGHARTDAGAPYPCTMVPPQLEPLPAVQA